MIRISKDYDERKREIIDTSMKLFIEKGYEDTSVNYIIKTIGISKGAFYYYFNTKEELLDAIVLERTGRVMKSILPIVEDDSLNAIEKINSLFSNAVRIKADMKEELQAIYRIFMDPRYMIIRYKLERQNTEKFSPELEKVIQQGIEEKAFRLDDSEGIAELILKLSSVLNDSILKLYKKYNAQPPVEIIIRKTTIYQQAMERILAAPEGSIKIFSEDSMRKAFTYN